MWAQCKSDSAALYKKRWLFSSDYKPTPLKNKRHHAASQYWMTAYRRLILKVSKIFFETVTKISFWKNPSRACKCLPTGRHPWLNLSETLKSNCNQKKNLYKEKKWNKIITISLAFQHRRVIRRKRWGSKQTVWTMIFRIIG